MIETPKKMGVEKWIFFPPLVLIALFCLWIFQDEQSAGAILENIFNFITFELSGFFQLYFLIILLVGIYMIATPFGNNRFGNEKPEFSTPTWLGMVFGCQAGMGVLTWTTIEFFYYLETPSWGIEPFSQEAQSWALVYPLFHWGFSAFALSCVFGVAFGYQFFCKKVDDVRPSMVCQNLIGEARAKGWTGRIIDIFFVIGSFCAVATCVGVNVPTLFGIINSVFDTQVGLATQAIIVFSFSVFMAILLYTGLNKGMKILSDVRTYVGFAILLYLFLMGPTGYLFNTFIDSVGLQLNNFMRLSLNTDPFFKSGTPQAWTIFYWCWYTALIFSVGIFLARVSKGRTVREYLVGTICALTFGAWIFFAVFQNYSMFIYESGAVPIGEILKEKGQGEAIAAIWSQFPYAEILMPVLLVYAFMAMQTLINGQVYTVAMITTKNLSGADEPPSWIKIFWSLVLGVTTVALLLIGGIRPFQTMTIIGSLPMVIIATLVLISFTKELKGGWKIVDSQNGSQKI